MSKNVILPFSKMHNSVDQAVTADVAPAQGIVLVLARPFRDIKEPQIGPHRLTLLAHFDEHVAVNL